MIASARDVPAAREARLPHARAAGTAGSTRPEAGSQPRAAGRSRRAPVPLAGFFLLTFAVSWLGAVPMVLASWRPGQQLPPGLAHLQLLLFFGTGLAALGVAWWNEGARGARALLRGLVAWRAGARWYAFVFLAPALLFWSALQAGAWLGPWLGLGAARMPRLGTPADVLATFAALFAGYLLLNTEELAWRGYALPRLLERHGPARASLLLGVLVSLFHLPLFLVRGGHPAGYPFPLFVVVVLALAVVFTWLAQHTGGSLLLAHLLHQTFNSWAEAVPFFPSVTGSLAPFLVALVALCAGAALILRRWHTAQRRPGHGTRVRAGFVSLRPRATPSP